MANAIRVENIKDFRGGLNLRPDTFELGDNESPDLLNVDLDVRGGVEQRKGVRKRPNTIGNPNLFTYDEATAAGSGTATMGVVNGSVARDTTGGHIGTTSWKVTNGGGATNILTHTPARAVVVGQPYTAFSWIRWSGGVTKPCHIRIDWYNGVGAFISSSIGPTFTPLSTYSLYSFTATAPATAATAYVMFMIGTTTVPAAGSTTNFSGLQFAEGYNASAWLDPRVTTFPGDITSIARYEKFGSTPVLFFTAGNILWWTDSEQFQNWKAVGAWFDTNTLQFKDDFYLVSAPYQTLKWSNGTFVAMGETYNDNLAAPTGTSLPKSKYIATFQGSVFIASTVEGGVSFPNRVRWSHPNQPGDWRSFDYADIDTGLDGDYITGMVALEDRLVVFKQNSMHVFTGTNPENFQQYPISRTVGAVDQRAIVNTDLGIYFFNWPQGVFLYNGKGLEWKFERLHPLITDGYIQPNLTAKIRLGWSGRRLWVSVPWRNVDASGAATVTKNTRVYILDPTLSKEGSWTAYDLSVGPMLLIQLANKTRVLIGGVPDVPHVWELEDPTAQRWGFDVDDTVTPGTMVQMSSYYMTKWFDLGNHGIKKRWKSPDFVFRKVALPVGHQVDVYRDYDASSPYRTFSADTTLSGPADWNTAMRSEVVKGRQLGTARAVSLKISGPSMPLQHWGLNAIALKFIPKPARG